MMGSMKQQVRYLFNENALQYDAQRKKLIPCFDDFYSIPVSLMKTTSEKPEVLDIGAGTGLFSAFVKEQFPTAALTLIDLSEKMIEVSKTRFQNEANMTYIIADYTEYNFEQSYDFIISSLSIHHLTDDEKRKLYQKIFTLLKPGGIFINADQVLGHTDFIEAAYKNDWKKKVEATDLTEQEIAAAYERTTLDKMTTLDHQLEWLKESGFQDVDCVYKYFNFVVLYGRK